MRGSSSRRNVADGGSRSRCGMQPGAIGNRFTALRSSEAPRQSPRPHRPRSSSIARSTRSGVAGASRRGARRWSSRLAMASRIASHTAIASISGGSPIALERKIVASRLGASANMRALKIGGTSRLPGNLVGRGAVGAQPPFCVPPQLFGGEPAHALHERALDLAQVDRRIERAAAVLEQLGAQDARLAGERVDRDLGGGRAIDEIVERPAGIGGEVPMDLRRAIEARRRQRYPLVPRQRRELGKRQAAVAGIDAVRREHDLARGHCEVLGRHLASCAP